MITLLSINNNTVAWSDSEEEYNYPRCLFPDNLTMDSRIEYCVGEFLYIGDE